MVVIPDLRNATQTARNSAAPPPTRGPLTRIIAPVAQSSELPLGLRVFLKAYRWRRIDPVPWSPMRKPLASSNIALVSTAGMVPRDQEPFNQQARGGDTSFRLIAGDIDVSTLVDSHRSESFDHRGIESDPNLGFPLDPLRELHRLGIVGALNHRHLSFMGSITAPGRLIAETAPAGAQLLVDDRVDAALLVPV
jgi:D-proline reductase (dithiol) PrdB